MSEQKNKFFNEAGKAGLVLAAVAIAYLLINALLAKVTSMRFLVNLLGILLWAGKFALCIWLMVRFLRTFAAENDKDRSRTFRYGMTIAACSALVYAGFYLLYVSYIAPDTFSKAIDTVAQAYSGMMTSEQIDQMVNMESSMPSISFFVNLIWCWLFGTIVSAIASRSICGYDNPFEDED